MTYPSRSKLLLVTGAGGRLGRLLKAAWKLDPPMTCTPVFLSRGAGADIEWRPGQPTENLPRCDAIVALWGCTAGSREDLAANSSLVWESHHLALSCGAERILHFSSAGVYGPGVGVSETSDVSPTTSYGQAKADMENVVRSLPEDGIRHCCLRLANVVGADSLAPALDPLKGPVHLDQFEDGRGPVRSYLAPGDLAQIIVQLSVLDGRRLPPILNASAERPIEMADLATAAGKEIVWRPAPETAIQSVTLNSANLANLLSQVEMRRTAQEMIADWRKLEANA